MTAATTTTSTPPVRPASPGRPRSWRWLRLATPFAVVLALVIATLVVHAMQEPDVTDPAFLNPGSPAPIGGQRLDSLLAARGVTVRTVTRTSDALVAASTGDVTLFVPAPSLVDPDHLRMLAQLPTGTRVVLVEPSALTLQPGPVTVGETGTRWATRATAPGCALPEARSAGVAGVYHVHYAHVDDATASCYGGALVSVRSDGPEVVLVGANEPFRNDRIDEYGNAALATGLLATKPEVVWLDLHHREPPPGLDPSARPNQAAPASPAPGDTDGTSGPTDRGGTGGGGNGDTGSTQPPPTPYWKLLPPWAWAALGLLLLAAVAYALARARRLGPPVGEPLPVVVRATETVEGRGRLYRRARARGTAAQALRDATLDRLRDGLDLLPDAPRQVVVQAVATRTGQPADHVDAVLFGAAPDTDPALVRLAADLDQILHTSITIAKGTHS